MSLENESNWSQRLRKAKALSKLKDTPNLDEFDPTLIPFQYQVLYDIENVYDYSKDTHELLLSGSLGSSKSLLLAHIAVNHCLKYKGARVCLARRAMPDIKRTIYNKIKSHIDGSLTEGAHYEINQTTAMIRFNNGSEIISSSWADRHGKKARSLDLSMLIVEELTENDEIDKDAIMELKMRVGRISSVPQRLWISATNPDSPAHWAYKYFIESNEQTRHVYYSLTSENPFLPDGYLEQTIRDLDPKMVERMIYGRWIEIAGEVIYYQYDRNFNFRNYDYEVNKAYPLRLCFDFNIGDGKPMSCALMQYIDDVLHFYDESVILTARTEQVLEDIENRGLLDKNQEIIVHGDAAGSHHDTRSKSSDYEIIKQFLQGRGYRFKIEVPPANPPLRRRHNVMNGYLCNSEGLRRLFVYRKCKTLDEGLRLVKIKQGGSYIEDEKFYQHITTAAGYGLDFITLNKQKSRMVQF